MFLRLRTKTNSRPPRLFVSSPERNKSIVYDNKTDTGRNVGFITNIRRATIRAHRLHIVVLIMENLYLSGTARKFRTSSISGAEGVVLNGIIFETRNAYVQPYTLGRVVRIFSAVQSFVISIETSSFWSYEFVVTRVSVTLGIYSCASRTLRSFYVRIPRTFSETNRTRARVHARRSIDNNYYARASFSLSSLRFNRKIVIASILS